MHIAIILIRLGKCGGCSESSLAIPSYIDLDFPAYIRSYDKRNEGVLSTGDVNWIS